jgi:hypothetical protein
MLGGYKVLSKGSVSKIFRDLPAHSRVRIVATVHAIDRWGGESLYLKTDTGANGEYEYSYTKAVDSANPTLTSKPLSICGDENFGEPNFSNVIDVSVRHKGSSFGVEVGSTIQVEGSGSTAFFGISQFNLYLK